MSDDVKVQRPDAPKYEPPHAPAVLTDRDFANLEKISQLRGFSGRMRAAIRDARDHLRPDEPAAKILDRALEERAP